MTQIRLVNMPFATLEMPSFALTQLRSVLDGALGGRVQTAVDYLNVDFARYLGGPDVYRGALTMDALTSGLGDWFFRQVAFPDAGDNSEAFFTRYLYRRDAHDVAARALVADKRAGLEAFLDELIDRDHLDAAAIVGFTSFFAQNVASIAMARRIKRRNPDVVIVMGGPNCEMQMGRALVQHVPVIDFVFSGPALRSFPRFVEAWLDGDVERCHRIDGVYSRENLSALPGQPPLASIGGRPTVAAMGEELPLDVAVPLDYGPYLDLLERTWPGPRVEPTLLFETSRGCWWGERAHCTFCGLNGSTMAYRAMPAPDAVQQFRHLFGYADRARKLDCVDNIMPREYVRTVLPEVEAPARMRIFYEVRADLDEDELRTLARAGVRRIQPGIEALATSTLKLMKKGTTSFRNLVFLKHCRAQGIVPAWNLLVGFPGETEEVYRTYVEAMPSLVHLPAPMGVFPVRFDRFSPYYTRAKEYGLDLEPYDFYRLTYPFPDEVLADLAYYFRDRNGTAEYVVHLNRWLARMREAHAPWARGWDDAAAEAPKLHFEAGGTIHDTRPGHVIRHDVGTLGRRVLEALDGPRDARALAAALPDASAEAVASGLRDLAARRLVFEEGGRYLSLVLAQDPPEVTREGFPRSAAETRPAAPALVRRERRAREVAPAS
jgi:magnesium-protoporphyrin IX monomethyl ester (oxidative) cyclase